MKTKKIQFFNEFYCATRCALRCAVLYSVMNFVVYFYLRERENKFQIAIYPKVHFAIIYIFEFCIFEYTFSSFYILLHLFSVMFIRKSMEC